MPVKTIFSLGRGEKYNKEFIELWGNPYLFIDVQEDGHFCAIDLTGHSNRLDPKKDEECIKLIHKVVAEDKKQVLVTVVEVSRFFVYTRVCGHSILLSILALL